MAKDTATTDQYPSRAQTQASSTTIEPVNTVTRRYYVAIREVSKGCKAGSLRELPTNPPVHTLKREKTPPTNSNQL